MCTLFLFRESQCGGELGQLVGGEKCPYGYVTYKGLRMERMHKCLEGKRMC